MTDGFEDARSIISRIRTNLRISQRTASFRRLFTVSDTAIRAGMLRGTRFNSVNQVALKLLRQFTIRGPCEMRFQIRAFSLT